VPADARGLTHGVRHQPAHTAVPVKERVDMVQSVMRRGNGKNFACGTTRETAVALGKVLHECRQAVRRWRQMPTYRHFFVVLVEGTGNDRLCNTIMFSDTQFRGHGVIETLVQILDELHRSRLRQRALRELFVDPGLYADMSGGLFSRGRLSTSSR